MIGSGVAVGPLGTIRVVSALVVTAAAVRTIGEHPNIRVSFTGISVLWVTKVKVLGANWGFQAVPADWIKSRIDGRSLDVPGSVGFSDLTFAPVWLGWHTPPLT